MKILAIGNSFSMDALEYLYQISDSLKQKITIGNLVIGGCPIDRHVQNVLGDLPEYEYFFNDNGCFNSVAGYSINRALSERRWDYVVMQQASGYSGVENSYEKLPVLIDYVKKLSSDSKLIWHMTWAYQQNSDHPHFAFYDNSQSKMYESIVNAVNRQVIEKGVFEKIVPVGTAIQNARTSSLGDTITRDGFHLDLQVGRYIAGLTFAKTLFGSIDGVSYKPDGVSDEEKNIAIKSVEYACGTPFSVTKVNNL